MKENGSSSKCNSREGTLSGKRRCFAYVRAMFCPTRGLFHCILLAWKKILSCTWIYFEIFSGFFILYFESFECTPSTHAFFARLYSRLHRITSTHAFIARLHCMPSLYDISALLFKRTPSAHAFIACLHCTLSSHSFIAHFHCTPSLHAFIARFHRTPLSHAFIARLHRTPSSHAFIARLHCTPSSHALIVRLHRTDMYSVYIFTLWKLKKKTCFLPSCFEIRESPL